MTNPSISLQTTKLGSDYTWKGSLVSEKARRLDIWYQSHTDRTITAGALQNLKSMLDDLILGELAYRASGKVYRDFLTQNSPEFDSSWLSITLAEIDKNEGISNSDQNKAIDAYQQAERQYLNTGLPVEIAEIGLGAVGIVTLAFLSVKYLIK